MINKKDLIKIYIILFLILIIFSSCSGVLPIPGESEPEINIKQGSNNIPSGIGTYIFEKVVADGDGGITSNYVVFTIENLGTENLIISSVTITGNNFDKTDPISNIVTPSSSTTFTIRFDPLISGKSAIITINNNDADEGAYTFKVLGIAIINETTGSVNFNIIYVSSGSYYVGDNPPGSDNVTLTKGYWIAETEVTYELWYEVNTWATSNGYTFANPGREGNDGTDGAAPTTAKYEPVTWINWRDAMIWCNALSEKRGLTPVYYTNSGFTIPIRSVTNNSSLDTAEGHEDNPYVNWNANGYKLPTEVEWEVATRGADIAKAGGTYGYKYSGSNNIDDVAWYWDNSGGVTHNVGTKNPNQIGIYDMSGNMNEWCWDWCGDYPSTSIDPIGVITGTDRINRGGHWCSAGGGVAETVYSRDYHYPYREDDWMGFRFIRNAD